MEIEKEIKEIREEIKELKNNIDSLYEYFNHAIKVLDAKIKESV